MDGWEEAIDGETESQRRERLAKAAAHDLPPFTVMPNTDRRFIRDALRAVRAQGDSGGSTDSPSGSWRDRPPLI
jgi:hypothetical protein